MRQTTNGIDPEYQHVRKYSHGHNDTTNDKKKDNSSNNNNNNNIKTSNSQPTFLTSTMNDENTSPSPTKHSNANEMNVMIDSPPTGLIAN